MTDSILQNANRDPLRDDYEFDAKFERERADGVFQTTDLWVRRQDAKAMISALDALDDAEDKLATLRVVVQNARVSEWPHRIDANELLIDLEQVLWPI